MEENYTDQETQQEVIIEQPSAPKRKTLMDRANDGWNSTPKQKKLNVLYALIVLFGGIFLFELYRLLVIFHII